MSTKTENRNNLNQQIANCRSQLTSKQLPKRIRLRLLTRLLKQLKGKR